MAEIAKKHANRLDELKKTVEDGQEYFRDNVQRYEDFMRFVFKSSLTAQEVSALQDTGKPTIEFNILEAFISRLRGEFAKQEPNLMVRAADGVPLSMLNREFSEMLSVIEAHLRAIFFDGANDMLEYNVYSDLLAGGFSVMRVFTEYVNEKSFEQNIKVERVFDPTLTVFDPLARDSHKGDGRYCAEIYPMTRGRFEDEYGKEAADQMKFTRSLSGFSWSYLNEDEEIVLICDFYEKQAKRVKIFKCTDGIARTQKEYDDLLEEWEESGKIEQPPLPDGTHERWTVIENIVRYRFCESKVLDFIETDYKFLPLVFVDGNSVNLKEAGSYTQMTRPYVYHARGIQRLKNFAGQSLANELENTIQHKFVAAIEAIPEKYLEAYQNVQKADVLLYKHFQDTHNPDVTLPPPREIARTPIPPEIPNTFRITDEMTQMILGSYDGAQGVQNAQLSGIAFARSAIQSNNASVPYVVGFIKGLNRVAQIIVDLIPKYYRTPRSLPILLPDGKRSYLAINKKGSLYMNFDPTHLEVKVETGVNFAMQKEIALQTIIQLTQANQGFAQFFNEEGLPVLLDNIDIRGIDQLKEKANEWMQRQKQAQMQQQQAQQQQLQQQAQEQAMQMAVLQKQIQSPTEGEVGAKLVEAKAQNDAAKIAIEAQKAETQRLEVLAKIESDQIDQELEAAKVQSENMRTQVEMVAKLGETISKELAEE